MVRTFLDTGVLFAAHRGAEPQRDKCLAILNATDRLFIASPFLYLETLPKAIYYRKTNEIEFYTTYFDNIEIWINDLESIVEIARDEEPLWPRCDGCSACGYSLLGRG